MNHQQTHQEEKFREVSFHNEVTWSANTTYISHMEMMTLLTDLKMRVRSYYAYQSVWWLLAKNAKANSKDPFAVVVTTGNFFVGC